MASPCTLMGVEYLLGSLMASNMLIVLRSFHARDGFDDWDIFVNLEYSLSGVYCMLSWTAGIRMLNQGILWNSCSNCLSTTKDLWQHWSLHIPGYQLQLMSQLYWVLGHFLSWIVSTNRGTKSWLKWLCCRWKELLFLFVMCSSVGLLTRIYMNFSFWTSGDSNMAHARYSEEM